MNAKVELINFLLYLSEKNTMAGLYLHIPFCRQACRYCDFYFTVSLKYRDQYIEALLNELSGRKEEARNTIINTIYLGGGTPSVLTQNHLEQIISKVRDNYSINEIAEFTIEANPDDLNSEYLEMLKSVGFNRLSIGIQSFYEKDLILMHRSHNEEQARESVLEARKRGFNNISIDLIYGLPEMDLLKWESNLKQALALPIQHLSAYHLTYEPGTIFHHWKKKGKITEINEKQSIEQYHLLKKLSEEKGYEHYEISNFSKPGYRSKHNSTYWNGSKYFGFGPGAHSYIGDERRWNASSLKLYINNLKTGEKYFSSEQLSRTDKFNDHLITRLRTKEGVDGRYLIKTFGEQTYNELLEACNEFILSNDLRKEGHTIWMTPEGWLKSDMIISKLML